MSALARVILKKQKKHLISSKNRINHPSVLKNSRTGIFCKTILHQCVVLIKTYILVYKMKPKIFNLEQKRQIKKKSCF